jgi:protein SCO1
LVRFAAVCGASQCCPGFAAAHDHPSGAAQPPVDAASEQAPVKVPDLPVLTQDGKKIYFYRDLVKGRTVVVDFIYTSCTAICSSMTANLREVQQQLGAAASQVELISITVDPKVDTPPVLKAFAKQFNTGPHWTFVTASAATIAKLQRGFTVSMARKEDHTPLVIIGNDSSGKWMRKFGLTRPEVIVAAIQQTAGRSDASP